MRLSFELVAARRLEESSYFASLVFLLQKLVFFLQ